MATNETKKIEVENVNHPGRVTRVDAAMYEAMKRAFLKILPRRSPGLTEKEIRAGVVAFLQKSDPSLLRSTAGVAAPTAEQRSQAGRRTLRPLWVALAALLILTPLGILAGGSAWGEWVASDYADPAIRQQIAASSLNLAPPPRAPQGIERLSSVWTAPFARYAPRYVRSAPFGYLLSAMFGAGCVMLAALAIGRLLARRGP